MSKKKLMALLLSGVMTATTVSVPVFAEDADAAEDTADAAEETEGGSSDTPLVVGQTNFSEKFAGLFAEAVPDQQIADVVGEYLFGNDRSGAIIYNGIEGETHEYNGTEYTLMDEYYRIDNDMLYLYNRDYLLSDMAEIPFKIDSLTQISSQGNIITTLQDDRFILSEQLKD